MKAPNDVDFQIGSNCKGTCRNIVFFERFWRTIEYSEINRQPYDSVSVALQSRCGCLVSDNGRDPYSSLNGETSHQAHLSPSLRFPLPARQCGKPTFKRARKHKARVCHRSPRQRKLIGRGSETQAYRVRGGMSGSKTNGQRPRV